MIFATPDPALDEGFAQALLGLLAYAVPDHEYDDDSLPAWRVRWLVAWERTDLVGALAWTQAAEVTVERVMVRRPEVEVELRDALTRLDLSA